MRLAEVSETRDNNFDVLRLLAAGLVLLSHSFILTGREDPAADVTGKTMGTTGIAIFFAISGFLVARSFQRTDRVRDYAVKRGLRLLPALWVCVLLTAFVLGPLVTTQPVGGYLTDTETWLYVLRNAVLETIGGTLPGVFATTPVPHAVNGSLWTLPVEAGCYTMIAVLGVLGLLGRRWALALLYAALLVAISPLGIARDIATSGTTGTEITSALLVVAIFTGGALLNAVRADVPLHPAMLLVAIAPWLLLRDGQWVAVLSALTIPVAVLVLAYRTPRALRALTAPGDVSYGVYLYAFPVQQALADHIDGIRPGEMFALALPITYALGLLSWHLVERPALRRKPASADPR